VARLLDEDGEVGGFPHLKAWLDNFASFSREGDVEMPSLRDFLYLERPAEPRGPYENEKEYWGRTTFRLKSELRARYKWGERGGPVEDFRHKLAGFTTPRPIRSKVFISHPYEREGAIVQRIVVWLPPSLRQQYGELPRGPEPRGDLSTDLMTFFLGTVTSETWLFSKI